MTFIAGAYTAVYDGSALGVIEDGFTIDWVSRSEDIVADLGGDAPLDGVYQGLEMQVSFTLSEWDAAGAQTAFWPFATTFGEVGGMGRLLSNMARVLLLTKCVAQGNQTPNTLTFDSAILAPGFNVSTFWGNKLRKVPLQMRILPRPSDGSLSIQPCETLRMFVVS